jgi:hypothetical protein
VSSVSRLVLGVSFAICCAAHKARACSVSNTRLSSSASNFVGLRPPEALPRGLVATYAVTVSAYASKHTDGVRDAIDGALGATK